MQEAPAAFVLNSQALSANPMNEPQINHVPPNQANSATDERLMLDFSQGKAEAFTQLFERYKPPVFAFFQRRVNDSARAEELTQETFLAIVRAAARYRPSALFRTYLYTIAYKILRAHRRKQAFRATFLGERKSTQDPATRDVTEAFCLFASRRGETPGRGSRDSAPARIRRIELRGNR